jgi:N utilization substance protein B
MNFKEKHEERKSIISALYMIDIRKCTVEESFKAVNLTDFVVESIKSVMYNIDDIDDVIIDNLQKWSLKRLNYVDRAIIRLAVYEMKYTETPPQVVIDEAIELSKEYSETDDFNSKAFNNRLLDNILKNM